MSDEEKNKEFELTGEDNVEEIELADVEEQNSGALKKVKEKLKKCEKEKLEHLENLQRAKAEFLNSKKRLEEQSIRNVERAANDHVIELLPLCDSFQMAMSDTEAWESVDQTWRKGIESIHNQLQTLLKSYNAEIINPVGKPFNPELHEAVSIIETEDDTDSETVMQVLQYGYKRNNELIRPAKVILSK